MLFHALKLKFLALKHMFLGLKYMFHVRKHKNHFIAETFVEHRGNICRTERKEKWKRQNPKRLKVFPELSKKYSKSFEKYSESSTCPYDYLPPLCPVYDKKCRIYLHIWHKKLIFAAKITRG